MSDKLKRHVLISPHDSLIALLAVIGGLLLCVVVIAHFAEKKYVPSVADKTPIISDEVDVVFLVDNEATLAPRLPAFRAAADDLRQNWWDCTPDSGHDIKYAVVEATDSELRVHQPLSDRMTLSETLAGLKSHGSSAGIDRPDVAMWRIFAGHFDEVLDRRPYARLVVVLVSTRYLERTQSIGRTMASINHWRHERNSRIFFLTDIPRTHLTAWTWLHFDRWNDPTSWGLCLTMRNLTYEPSATSP